MRVHDEWNESSAGLQPAGGFQFEVTIDERPRSDDEHAQKSSDDSDSDDGDSSHGSDSPGNQQRARRASGSRRRLAASGSHKRQRLVPVVHRARGSSVTAEAGALGVSKSGRARKPRTQPDM